MFTESLAGTGVQYRKMQARRWEGTLLHFQIDGEKINRKYGASFTVQAPEDIIEAVEAANDTTVSLAGSGKEYAILQAKQVGDSEIHVQVAGSSGNRDYGASFNVAVPLDLDPLF